MEIVPGKWTAGGEPGYLARLGARTSTLDEDCDEICACLETGYLAQRAGIPAVNRWNKVYQLMSWWTVELNCYNVVGDSFVMAKQALPDQTAKQGNQHITGVYATGHVSDATGQNKTAARWGKTTTWLSNPLPAAGMNRCITVFRMGLGLLGVLFKASHVGREAMA